MVQSWSRDTQVAVEKIYKRGLRKPLLLQGFFRKPLLLLKSFIMDFRQGSKYAMFLY